jgi:hypothetical protein
MVLISSSLPSIPAALCVSSGTDGVSTELSFCGSEPFHTTASAVSDARLIEVPNAAVRLVLWNEQASGGPIAPFYALSFDGETIERVKRTSYDLQLKYGSFEPL